MCLFVIEVGTVFYEVVGFVAEMRQTSRRNNVNCFYVPFSGCGELACRPGLSKGGTGLSLTIHHHGIEQKNTSLLQCGID